MTLVGDGDGPVGPGDYVLLTRGEVEHVDKGMSKPLLTRPRGAAPELDTLLMDGHQIASHRGPLYEALGPMLAVDDGLGGLFFVIPEDTDGVGPVHGELIATTTARIGQKGAQVLLLDEGLDLGRHVVLFDPPLATVTVDVGHLVDSQGVLLVQGHHVQLPHGGGGLGRRGEFDKGESVAGLASPEFQKLRSSEVQTV